MKRNIKESPKIFIISVLSIIIILFIPWVLHLLLSTGSNSAWVSILGTYIGSVISGYITFIGVVLTLKFTKNENNKSRLPNKIQNADECLDILSDYIKKIRTFSAVDMEEHLMKSSHERSLKLYEISENFVLIPTDAEKLITKEFPKQIRGHLSHVNAKSYKEYRKFSINLSLQYMKFIFPVEKELEIFQQDLMDGYMDTDAHIIISGNLNELPLLSEDKERLKKIQSDLYYKEKEFLLSLENLCEEFKIKIGEITTELTNEMDY